MSRNRLIYVDSMGVCHLMKARMELTASIELNIRHIYVKWRAFTVLKGRSLVCMIASNLSHYLVIANIPNINIQNHF